MLKIIPYDEVDFVWVAHHYDIHLHGICMYDGQLCEFITDYPDSEEEWLKPMVEIRSLSWYQKLSWIVRKKLFEICVGYHWTYPYRAEGERFHLRKPTWLFAFLARTYYRVKRWVQ